MEPIRVHSGESITLTTGGPLPDIILTGPCRPFRGCYVGACPYYDIEDDSRETEDEGLEPVEWIPGIGLVHKKS